MIRIANAANVDIIGGRVLDEDNQALSGVNVKVLGTNFNTVIGSDGSYVFFDLHAGKYKLEFSLAGFETAREGIVVEEYSDEFSHLSVIPTVEMEKVPIKFEEIPVFREEENINAYNVKILDSNKFVFPENPKYYVYNPDKKQIIYRTVFHRHFSYMFIHMQED